MPQFKLSQMEAWLGKSWSKESEKDRSYEIVFDSRRVDENTIFWPLKGVNHDAHNFIEGLQVKEPFFVAESRWLEKQNSLSGTFLEIEDSNESLGILASNRMTELAAQRIAITGSNGKTTTKEMLQSVLSEFGNTTATLGNLNNHIGVPMTLLDVQEETDFAIVEAGTNHPGEIAYLSKLIRPNLVVITNVGDSHLEFFKTRKNVLKEKVTLSDYATKEAKTIVPNSDELLQEWSQGKDFVFTVGSGEASFCTSKVKYDEKGCGSFFYSGFEIKLNVPGVHNAQNAMIVMACVECLGLDLKKAAKVLSAYEGRLLRSEWKSIQGVSFFVDCYNANPSSMKAAMETFGLLGDVKRKVAIIGSMYELGTLSEEAHQNLAPILLENGFSAVWMVGEEMKPLAEILEEEKLIPSYHVDRVDELVEYAKKNLERGDCVLLKASRGVKLDVMIKEYGEV